MMGLDHPILVRYLFKYMASFLDMGLILSIAALLASSDLFFALTGASSSSCRDYRSQEAIQDHHDYTSANQWSQLQQMNLSESYQDDTAQVNSAAYRWLSPENEISEGPSLATRMMEEEQEDTASTSMTYFQESTPAHQESQNEDLAAASAHSEMDPTTQELREMSYRRTVHSSVAWHAGYPRKYINILRVFINMMMVKRRVDSRKSFKRAADSLTPELVELVQDIYDRLDGWPRHEALEKLADETANMTLRYATNWKKGLTLQEVEELKRLIKESGRIQGGAFMRSLDLQGRKNALIPGTKENDRITKVFARREGAAETHE